MKIPCQKRLIGAAAGAVVIIIATSAAGNPADAAPAQPRHGHAMSSQCSVPMGQRAGGWMCVMPSPTAAALSGAAGHCKPHESWCWHLLPGAGRSTWMGSFVYGYGKKTFGKISVYYEVALDGRRSVSKPVRFTSSAAVRHLIIEGDRLYYDANWPAGHPIRPRVHESYVHFPANVPAGDAVAWPGGYVAFEEAPVHYGAVIHTWTWNVSGYPGTWYVFGKTIHYYFRGKSAFFFKQWQKHLGRQPVGYGWHE